MRTSLKLVDLDAIDAASPPNKQESSHDAAIPSG
jgi:hypothetical protein